LARSLTIFTASVRGQATTLPCKAFQGRVTVLHGSRLKSTRVAGEPLKDW